jgi:hypothetical protein
MMILPRLALRKASSGITRARTSTCFRREPGGFGLDADLGRRELRKHIVFGVAFDLDPRPFGGHGLFRSRERYLSSSERQEPEGHRLAEW